MDMGLSGRTAVVTGGTANIGRATCTALASEGANVVVVGRNEEKGLEVVADVERAGGQGLWVSCDVTDRAQVDAMVEAAVQRFGAIDVLVTAAGNIASVAAFVDSDPATWELDLSWNLTSVLHVTQAVLPHMIAQGRGRVVHVGSTAADIGDSLMSVYSAAKGAIHTFTRTLARETAAHGITVNAVSPYGTRPDDPAHVSSGSRTAPDSPMMQGIIGLDDKSVLGHKTLIPRLAKASEVASGIVYLASDHAAYVTGEILTMDGGARIAS
ncbi:SDR family NAD(P)-dependent oxidoreductase [Nocardioides sp. cx-173]|uniref:SDR family NAD(P)-dependent oxidoreductase n=1 Tax=Nocardioides sp. cx-173 TaxID=2898796 RepID=UPI001E48275C|nr:SDR family NAD(P)-dependent oxidoreductase [Nocardioides sp. cx-173]MCD4524648.1 SDR family oxidoreductase [Nocardioides sp. cx-173]UGB42872.1 SDR family oxidoreductase [Nocardioides sp. cx-173]